MLVDAGAVFCELLFNGWFASAALLEAVPADGVWYAGTHPGSPSGQLQPPTLFGPYGHVQTSGLIAFVGGGHSARCCASKMAGAALRAIICHVACCIGLLGLVMMLDRSELAIGVGKDVATLASATVAIRTKAKVINQVLGLFILVLLLWISHPFSTKLRVWISMRYRI